jgi:uncharacterized membrane protein YagU involved in acid resistance
MSKADTRSKGNLHKPRGRRVDARYESRFEGGTRQLSLRSMVVAILMGGLFAGTIDIGSACLINGAAPALILRAIAGGLLGKSAYSGGMVTAGLGLLLQLAMSIFIAAMFVVAGHWLPILRRHWIKAGLAYGVVVFFVMNYVVLPLSAIGHAPRFRIAHFSEDMLAMLLFGLIVAFFARRIAPAPERVADSPTDISP